MHQPSDESGRVYEDAIEGARELLREQLRDPVGEANPEYTRGVINLVAEIFSVWGMETAIRMVQVAIDIGLAPEDPFFHDYTTLDIEFAKEVQ